jgi:hypothetical protein
MLTHRISKLCLGLNFVRSACVQINLHHTGSKSRECFLNECSNTFTFSKILKDLTVSMCVRLER